MSVSADNLPVVIEGTVLGGEPPFKRYRTPKFDDARKERYVQFIRQGLRRVRAAEACGVTYTTVARHMNLDDQFAEDVTEAEMAMIDEVEEALYETAKAGNVVAQQVILYNRRGDMWSDQRQLKQRLEDAALEAERGAEENPTQALDGLRAKILTLRERLNPDIAESEPHLVSVHDNN